MLFRLRLEDGPKLEACKHETCVHVCAGWWDKWIPELSFKVSNNQENIALPSKSAKKNQRKLFLTCFHVLRALSSKNNRFLKTFTFSEFAFGFSI